MGLGFSLNFLRPLFLLRCRNRPRVVALREHIGEQFRAVLRAMQSGVVGLEDAPSQPDTDYFKVARYAMRLARASALDTPAWPISLPSTMALGPLR